MLVEVLAANPPLAEPPLLKSRFPLARRVTPMLVNGMAMVLVPAPPCLFKAPELLKVGVPLEVVRPTSLRRFSVPPLLRAALPEMLNVEPRFSVPLMLRIRELMVGEAPAGIVAA